MRDRLTLFASGAVRVPAGTVAVGIGLVVLGLTSFGFLGIAARSLSSTQFALLGVVWTVLFTLGPGAFLPLEQETAKRLAVIDDPHVAQVVIRRALGVGGVLAALVALVTVAGMLATGGRLLDSDVAVLIAMIAATSVLAVVHCSRGWLAGNGRFKLYGAQLALDGLFRLAGAGALLVAGVHSAAAFGWVLFASQVAAVAVTATRVRFGHPQASPEQLDSSLLRAVSLTVLARSIALMVAATLAAQLVINAGPIAVKVLAAPTDVAAGLFLTTLIMARIPLFMFAALQAALLPGLARMVDAERWEQMEASLRRLAAQLAVVGVAFAAALAVAGPTIAGLIFGPTYRAARGTAAIGWWIGVASFAACLANSVDLPMRVSVALLVGSAAAGLFFCWAVRAQVRRRRAPTQDLGARTTVAET